MKSHDFLVFPIQVYLCSSIVFLVRNELDYYLNRLLCSLVDRVPQVNLGSLPIISKANLSSLSLLSLQSFSSLYLLLLFPFKIFLSLCLTRISKFIPRWLSMICLFMLWIITRKFIIWSPYHGRHCRFLFWCEGYRSIRYYVRRNEGDEIRPSQ